MNISSRVIRKLFVILSMPINIHFPFATINQHFLFKFIDSVMQIKKYFGDFHVKLFTACVQQLPTKKVKKKHMSRAFNIQ